MRIFRVLAATMAACGMLFALALPALAGAQSVGSPSASQPSGQTAHSFTGIPATGRAGKRTFAGTFTVQRLVVRGNRVFVVGQLSGKLGHRRVSRSGVMIPISVNHAAVGSAAVCPILNLTLGPLDLNLLGLVVHLNQVHLVINAVSGPGNLLGNLLCDVAHLLDSTPGLSPAQLSGLLNILQQLVALPALGNL